MQRIEAILFEPVGCLAEFRAEPFHEIAVRFFGRAANKPVSKSASRAYWHLLNLMQMSHSPLDAAQAAEISALEAQAVMGASLYEDVVPALSELTAIGVKVFIASSLSSAAVECFVEKNHLQSFFPLVTHRENAEGIKSAALATTLAAARLAPDHVMFLVDTLEGLKVANGLGVQSILMMNDPDEARRLAMHGSPHKPAGGIVSLHELPDFIRLVAANARH